MEEFMTDGAEHPAQVDASSHMDFKMCIHKYSHVNGQGTILLPSTQPSSEVDVEFVLPGGEEGEEVIVYAHRSVVAGRSEYFRVLLTNGMKETHQQRINIPNIAPNLFRDVLEFIYTGSLSLNNANVSATFEACDLFLLEEGKLLCKQFIESKMSNEALADLLLEKDTLCSELTRIYYHQAARNASFFLKPPFIYQLPKDVLSSLLQCDNIPMRELQIFKGVAAWASKHGGKVTDVLSLIRYSQMEYDDLRHYVEGTGIVPQEYLLEAYRHLARPKLAPLEGIDLENIRLRPRVKAEALVPGSEIVSLGCLDHKNCKAVSWNITNFSAIKSQKHLSNMFEINGLRWRLWAYPAGEAKHADSFSVYLEAIRVKERESYDFVRNTTFFFALINQKNKHLSRFYPSSPNVLFNYEKSVWGNGLVELKLLYDGSLGYVVNDTVSIHLHLLECIALEG